MSIVVTTPTGNIGRVLTQALVDAGEKPVLIARNADKVKTFVDAGATVKEGRHHDAAFLTEATRGARALFVLTPSNFQLTEIRGFYRGFAEAAAAAIDANRIGHVLHLSSVGAELETGNGPVAGLHVAEQVLNRTKANVLHLRPGYFMENTLGQIPSILQASSLFTTFPRGTRFEMIATRDVGAYAADRLTKLDWSGTSTAELQGPGETGYDEVAAVLSEVLDKALTHVTVSDDQMREALAGIGISKAMADSLVELADGIVKGRVEYHEPRTAENTTPTTYPQFAQDVFKPAFEAAARAES